MVNKREQLAEAVLNHALEIICLLTVEDFIVVKRPHERTRCTLSIRATEINSNGSPSACPELFFTLQGMEDKTLKILVELANKILWLLTREVPVKCEDVEVCFSDGECDGLEEHGEQYNNNHDTCTIEQPTSLVQQNTENNDHMTCCIKEEPDEEPHVNEFILNTPERRIPLLTMNDHIPAQSASGSSFIFSSDNQPESGEGSFGNATNRLDAESPRFFSPERNQVYNIIDHIKQEPVESQEFYISASGATISPADKDEDYLPPKTIHKSTGKGKSRSGKTSPPCEVCGKVFGSKSSLDRHFQIHTGQRPFPCNKCGKRFSCRNHLTTHERTHSGERPFACNQCGRRFINHQHLVLHQVTHTGEKPFSCPVCGKGFTRQSSVVKHSGMHAEQKPFVCKECGKSYCQYANLVVHQRLHSGEKPFVCMYCEKAFICKATMLRHQMAHTGEKPFPCPQCNKCFIDNSTLSKHKRRVHNKEPKPA